MHFFLSGCLELLYIAISLFDDPLYSYLYVVCFETFLQVKVQVVSFLFIDKFHLLIHCAEFFYNLLFLPNISCRCRLLSGKSLWYCILVWSFQNWFLLNKYFRWCSGWPYHPYFATLFIYLITELKIVLNYYYYDILLVVYFLGSLLI